MSAKTGIKITFSIILLMWIVYFLKEAELSHSSSAAELLLGLFLLLVAPIGILVSLLISIYNEYSKERELKEKVALNKKILTIVASNNKPMSVYDFMVRIRDTEENIRNELEKFVTKGLAEKIINEKGLILYKFYLIPADEERKDILE